MNRKHLASPLAAFVLAVVLVAGAASAAIVVSHHVSEIRTSARAPPVTFEAGAASASQAYVQSFALTPDAMGLHVTLQGVPDAQVTLADLARLHNAHLDPKDVRLTAQPVSSPHVTTLRLDLVRNGTAVASLDLLSDAPSAHVTLAAGETVKLEAHVGLAESAPAETLAPARAVSLTLHEGASA